MEAAEAMKVDHELYVGALKSLDAIQYVQLETFSFDVLNLTQEGQQGDDGADMADLKASLGDAVVKIGMGAAMKNKWLRKEGTVLKRALAGVVDEVQAQLREIELAGGAEGVLPSDVLQNLIKRKMVVRATKKP